jgi:uncharacterized protein (TIGR02145 family)
MAENLNVSRFRNGDTIPEAISEEEWRTSGDEGKPAWCYYDNDPENGKEYGKIYNWYAVNDPRGLAPEGWHITSDEEWIMLADYLGGEDVAGDKMKSIGAQYWVRLDGSDEYWDRQDAATNESGFSGLPGGVRIWWGTFSLIGNYGGWWSSTENDAASVWYRYLKFGDGSANRNANEKGNGFSVRCLRD